MEQEIKAMLIEVEKLRQIAHSINKSANKLTEEIVVKQRDEFNIVYDNTEIKKLSRLSNITYKIMKDLDDAEEKILNDFKLGE